MLRQGHRLTLYCYHTPDGVPDGVQLADARSVLPEGSIVRYASGSHSLFSNRFRYELQRLGAGTWMDCDAYLLRPLDGARAYLVGEYERGRVNPGVLRLPSDSPILPTLLGPFDDRTVPAWLPLRAKLAAWWRLATTGRTGIEKMPWGSTGPRALTAAVRGAPVAIDVDPPEVFYPVRWQDAEWVADPRSPLQERITERTVSVHLWNERIKHLKNRPAPSGSFLARLQAEGA